MIAVDVRTRLLETAPKNSYPFKGYAHLNFELASFQQIKTDSENIQQILSHALSYVIWNYSINSNVCKSKQVVELLIRFFFVN